MSASTDLKPITGGEFLIRGVQASEIFIPEEWGEEQLMMKQTCDDFVNQNVVPKLEEIDHQEPGLMEKILDKSGELGLLGISVPEEYGGMGMDFKTSMLCTESLGKGHAFSVAYGAHTGIGTLPILYYGNEEQKKRFIPKLATGEWKGCYCLTEPGSGSDANSGKTKAVLSENGKHYILNGQKMWITNAGFAHVLTVFAKIDNDENLSAFILTRDMQGITFNAEEKKMGIKGSSTRQIFFNNVMVPVENLLYERGKGFHIAVNILNIGRIKLAGGVLGGSKQVCDDGIRYANEREQFGRPIAKYGAIRRKIAEIATRIYALESATYRATQNIDDATNALVQSGMDKGNATIKGIASFAPECAILKVFGSEVLDFSVDESLQIHGGMGYSAETRVERAYRDSRINRIFEGTNEINRLLTVDMILKKGLKGELDLMTPATAVAGELMSIPDMSEPPANVFAQHSLYIANFKKAILMVAGAAVQKLMNELQKEQEVLMNIADMIINTYVAESTLLRTQKLATIRGEENVREQIEMMKVFIYDASLVIDESAKEALLSFATGDEQRMMLTGLRRFTKIEPFNIRDSRRTVAARMIAENKYCF
ncbi:MAG: acyl-CoA dehydrogenase family protein [Crocinitomicaceae bacterium]|nr:acyl-CoA dehydrogenase family protein [Crocinitomicaceae bacterium]